MGAKVLGYLSLKDIVTLKGGCGSIKSYQLFVFCFPYRAAVELPFNKHAMVAVLEFVCEIEVSIQSLPICISKVLIW